MTVWGRSPVLSIYASDGALVRSLRPQDGLLDVDWDMRNSHERLVAPGLYRYHWDGAAGAVDGRLVVGH
jgi:hypothetical protein